MIKKLFIYFSKTLIQASHLHIYIYISVCVCVSLCLSLLNIKFNWLQEICSQYIHIYVKVTLFNG
jgi:hypothetical protein